MDGRGRRRNRWAAGTLLVAAAAVGCNRNATLPDTPNPPLPAAEAKAPPDAAKRFATAGPPPAVAADPPRRKPGEPLKPETEVALADTTLESAYADGRSAVERDQLLDTARQGYQRALKAQPKSQAAALGLARLYAKAGDKERAVETLRAAVKASPKDHGLAHRLAATQSKFGDWAGAVESCRAALALDPENRTYHKTLGFNLAQLGQWDEAHATLARVMGDAEAHYFLGRVLYDQDKPAEARARMELATRADPQFVLAKQFVTDLDAAPAAAVSVTPAAGVQTVGHTEPAADDAVWRSRAGSPAPASR